MTPNGRDFSFFLFFDQSGHVHAGGELQRFAIAVVAAQQADIYMIDEPSSYLDVRQRLKAAQVLPPSMHVSYSSPDPHNITADDIPINLCVMHFMTYTVAKLHNSMGSMY